MEKAVRKRMETSTEIKRQYLKWKAQQPKGDKTSFATWVKAKHPGYREPRYGQVVSKIPRGLSRQSKRQLQTLSKADREAALKLIK